MSKFRSDQNMFILKPTRLDTYYKTEIKIDYSPLYSEYTQKKERIIPNLNLDFKPYFPGFIIEHDKPFIE